MRSPNFYQLDKETLSEQYLSGMNCPELSEIYGCSISTIIRHLRTYGIEIRSCQQTAKTLGKRKKIDPDWLQVQYVDENRSLKSLAVELGCSVNTVKRAMEDVGIERRSPPNSIALLLSQKQHHFQQPKSTKTRHAQHSNAVKYKLSLKNRGMTKFPDSPNKGCLLYGSSWGWVKKLVFLRDRGVCRVCGYTSNIPREIHMHHVVPAILFAVPDHSSVLGNIVTLCNRCHEVAEAIYYFDPRLDTRLQFSITTLIHEWSQAYNENKIPWNKVRQKRKTNEK